jgi:hypothetical protein
MNIQNTFYWVKPMNDVANVNRAFSIVDKHGLMSPHEKQQAKERAAAQREGLKMTVVNALKSDWATVKSEYQTLRREKIAAKDRSEKRWDLARVTYNKESARALWQSASIETLNKRYEQIDLAGDTHALRAFVEVGLETMLTRKFTDHETVKAVMLRQDMEKTLDGLTVSKEEKELAAQGSILTHKIAQLQDATDQARAMFAGRELIDLYNQDGQDQAHEKELANRHLFDGLGDGIQVKRTVDTDLVTHTEIRGLENWD